MKDAVRQVERKRERERVEERENDEINQDEKNKETTWMWTCPVTFHLEVKQRSEIRQRCGQ